MTEEEVLRRREQLDWHVWHTDYDDPTSGHSQRLATVQRLLAVALDAAPAGPINVLSLCAGQGRDVIGVLPHHPRRHDVRARLVELDADLAAQARASAGSAGLDNVEVVTADAGSTDAANGLGPANVLMLCGIFGNIPTEDVARTIRLAPTLCAARAAVLWTRHRRDPDLTPFVREWFARAGFAEVEFDPSVNAVGYHRLTASPAPFESGVGLFAFGPPAPLLVDDVLLRRLSRASERFGLRRLELMGDVELTPFAESAVIAPVDRARPDLDFVNRVIGLRPEHAGLVPDIVEHYRTAGVQPWFEIAPFAGYDELADALTAAGAVQIDVHGILAGRPASGPMSEPSPGVDVFVSDEPVRFGRVLAEGLEIPDPPRADAATGFAGWTSEPGWTAIEATVDGAAAGAGLLALDGEVGYLATAATLPSGRGRGVQSALIARRRQLAAAAGCELVLSLAAPTSTSARNLQRSGLQMVGTLSVWRVR